ncbi:MAG: 1-deoxy-D-xylulose-5-phosphate reductoisomerase [candidate division WOR-3 bacterium]
MRKNIVLLGASGSIGRQTLDVIRKLNLNLLAVSVHDNTQTLAEIVKEFGVKKVAITGKAEPPSGVEVYYGKDGLIEISTLPDADVVVVATNGTIGVFPTIEALKSGKRVALANKETLVSFGPFVKEVVKFGELIPVDSEHSSAFQLFQGVKRDEVKKLILTASGGPFRDWKREEIERAKPEDALKHPTWKMGKKITVDSATLMNKGLELIEAHFLFDLSPEEIDVRIHPQSVIHAILLLRDNSLKIHASKPDMRIPIQYAITYPERVETQIEPFDYGNLELLPVDKEKFPALDLAYKALRLGGTYPAVLNAANEVAVYSFLEGKIGFYGITDVVERVMEENPFKNAKKFSEYLEADDWARKRAEEIINGKI